MHDDDDSVFSAVQAGARGYLVKGARQAELLRAVRSVADGGAVFGPAIARRLVQQLALKPGERVLSIAHPAIFEDLLPYIRYEVMRAGGIDLGVVEVLREPVPEAFELDTSALELSEDPPPQPARTSDPHASRQRKPGAGRRARIGAMFSER